jgi:hypothetical protein
MKANALYYMDEYNDSLSIQSKCPIHMVSGVRCKITIMVRTALTSESIRGCKLYLVLV